MAAKRDDISIKLVNEELWKEFSPHTTEMIVTKSGRFALLSTFEMPSGLHGAVVRLLQWGFKCPVFLVSKFFAVYLHVFFGLCSLF